MVVTDSANQTQKVAFDFSKRLRGGEILALFGDLGSGKTTFIQGLAQGLGIKKRIISPTFVLVRQYPIPPRPPAQAQALRARPKPYTLYPRPYVFCHIDLYRLGEIKEIENLGIEEIFSDKNAIVAIEWADRLGKNLPKRAIRIYFEHIRANQRRIKMKNVK